MEQQEEEILTKGKLKKRISSEFVPICSQIGNDELVSDCVVQSLEEIAAHFPTPPTHVPQHRSPTNEPVPATSTYSTAMKATSSYLGSLRQAMTDRVSGISMAKK